MSKLVNLNHTDTAVGGVGSLSLPISVLNYAADFGVQDGSGAELHLINNTSPIDCPETVRYAITDVANIYKGTAIDPNLFMDTKRGVSLLVQLNQVYTVTDAAVPAYTRVLPIKAHMVLQLPVDQVLTADMVKDIVGRLNSCLFDTGVVTSARISRLLRGSLRPSDL